MLLSASKRVAAKSDCRQKGDRRALLDITISGAGVAAFVLICPLMMVLMMVGMAMMGSGHGHGMCHFWSHGEHHEPQHWEDKASK